MSDHTASAAAATAEFDSIVGRFRTEVHWGDCDPAGIIFYPTYFRWFDAATWNFFSQVGYTVKRMRAEHLATPLVSAQCQFKASPVHGDVCEVMSRIVRWGGKSFNLAHQVVREDGMLLAEGSETRVWARRADADAPLRGVTIDEDLKALFRAPR
ncbi:MAG: acyl-CoA thioesterase [Betaproteobacteria bacterium]|nr:acyl-CoA thioesterase [Betaproteobacteria bacterium]